jgi:hypothetical protein
LAILSSSQVFARDPSRVFQNLSIIIDKFTHRQQTALEIRDPETIEEFEADRQGFTGFGKRQEPIQSQAFKTTITADIPNCRRRDDRK